MAALAFLTPGLVHAKKKEKPEVTAFAVIAGTAFRPPGLSLAGVKVRVRPESAAAPDGSKLREAEAMTDGRGEFAIRVPAVPMKWTVNVQASGYHSMSKSVVVDGEHRQELSFLLEPTGGK